MRWETVRLPQTRSFASRTAPVKRHGNTYNTQIDVCFQSNQNRKGKCSKKRTVCPIATPRFDKELGLRSRNFRLAGVAVPHGGHNHCKHYSGDYHWNQHGQIHKLEPHAIQNDTYNGVDDDSA